MRMKHPWIKTLAGSGLLLLTLTASAQYPQRPPEPYPYQVQDEREARQTDRLFDRLRGDLDSAHAGTLPYSADRNRVMVARDRVEDCQRAVNAGDYDRRLFDDTIVAIQRVVDLNRLSDRTHNYLADDLNQLRSMRARLEG